MAFVPLNEPEQTRDDEVRLKEDNVPNVSEKTAVEKAERLNFGLQDRSPGLDVLTNNLRIGKESDIRRRVAQQRDNVRAAQRIRMIDDILEGNRELVPNEMALINGLTADEETNPNTVFEIEFARSFLNTMATSEEDDEEVISAGLRDNLDETLDMIEGTENIITKKNIINNKLMDAQDQWANQSWLGTISDFGQVMVPFLSDWRQAQAFDTGVPTQILPGSNISEQVEALWLMPPDRFEASLQSAIDYLAPRNTLDLMRFLGAVQSYSTDDQNFDNLLFGLDVFDVGLISGTVIAGVRAGKAATRTAGAAEAVTPDRVRRRSELERAMKDMSDATDIPVTRYDDILERTGKVAEASNVTALQRLGVIPRNTNPTGVEETMRSLPSFWRPSTNPLRDSGTLSRQAADRLAMAHRRTLERMHQALSDPIRPNRLNEDQLASAAAETEATLRRDYNHLNDAVIDLINNGLDDRGVYTTTMRMGGPNAAPFPDADLARFYGEEIYGLGPNDFNIHQQGSGFYLDVTRPWDETTDAVRAAAAPTDKQDPRWMGEVFMDALRGTIPKWLKGSGEVLPESQAGVRLAGQQGFKNFLELTKELVTPIARLTKNEKTDLESVLKANRDYINPATGDRGMFHDTVGGLENAYMDRLQRLPSEQEIEAYFNYVHLNNLDWAVRNQSLYREKARLGLKEFSFDLPVTQSDGSVSISRIPNFEGKPVERIAWDSPDNPAIMVYDGKSQAANVTFKNNADRSFIQSLIDDEGYRIIEVDGPSKRPFRDVPGVANEIIRYAVVKKFDQHELPWQQLPYRPGGHVEYKYPWYLKQAQFSRSGDGRLNYEGDFALMNFTTRAEAKKYETAFNEGLSLLRAGDETGLRAHLKKNLPYTLNRFKKLIKDNNLDPSVPIRLTGSNRRIGDDPNFSKEYPGVRDYSNREYDISSDLNRQYVGARSGPLMTITRQGTEENPAFNFRPADLVDPFTNMSTALYRAGQNRFLGDYKISAMEDWISRHGRALDVPTEDLQRSPMKYLYDPKWSTDPQHTDAVRAAKADQRAILDLLGRQTWTGRAIENAKLRLFDSIFTKTGKPPKRLIDTLSYSSKLDPAGYLRAVSFHTKLGLLNVLQLPLQASGTAHAIALSPKHGMISSIAYMPTRWYMHNPSPELLKTMDQRMMKLGWKRGEFEESILAMESTSWHRIGKESSWRNDLADPITFDGGSNLDKATFFYSEGERIPRVVSWHTAYREWRELNPTRSLNNKAKQDILQRADLLANNMTRAGQASWERGALSVPTQFLSYHMRLWDAMLGKRLTSAEKARAMGMYSMMYGVPAAVGVPLGINVAEEFRRAMIERGYDPKKAPIVARAFLEGIPQLAAGMIGTEDMAVSERYAPGAGLDFVRQFYMGDITAGEMLVGAGGNVFGDVVRTSGNLGWHLMEFIKEGGAYEPVAEDFLDVTRNLSSVNNALKVYMAMNTGRYYSKTGTYLTDFTTGQALFSAMTGIEPQELSDAYQMLRSNRLQSEAERVLRKDFTRYYRRGFDEAAKGNDEAAEAYWKRARAIVIAGDINQNRQMRWVQEAINGNESLVDNVMSRFWQNAPQRQVRPRLEREIDRQQERRE